MTTLTVARASAGHLGQDPWDLAGAGASALCILHCLVTPLLAAGLPALELLERPAHTAFAIAILCIGLLAFIPGYRRHRSGLVVLVGLLGFGFLAAGPLLPAGVLRESVETSLTVLGGSLLIAAHLRNACLCRSCRQCQRLSCSAELAGARQN